MECYHFAQFALLSTPEVDFEDVMLGQLLTLLVGLTVAVLGRALWLLFSSF